MKNKKNGKYMYSTLIKRVLTTCFSYPITLQVQTISESHRYTWFDYVFMWYHDRFGKMYLWIVLNTFLTFENKYLSRFKL